MSRTQEVVLEILDFDRCNPTMIYGPSLAQPALVIRTFRLHVNRQCPTTNSEQPSTADQVGITKFEFLSACYFPDYSYSDDDQDQEPIAKITLPRVHGY
jgi:hypothetical protein